MPYEMEMPESFDTGGSFLTEPGTYHFSVLNVDEQPQSRGGQLIDGFRVDMDVVAGSQSKKQVEVVFFNPKLTDKNGGEMAKKKQARFVIATGLLQAAKPGERVTVDLQQAKGRQLVATMSKRKSQDGDKEYIDLNFADIWHVDDPAAPNCERNQDALKLLPKSLRRDAASFQKQAAGNGRASGNGHAQQQQKPPTAPAAAPAGDSLLDEI